MFNNVTIFCNSDYANCTTQITNNTKLDFELKLFKPIDQVILAYRFDVKILGHPSEMHEFTNYMNKTYDMCKFLKNPMLIDPLLGMFYKIAAANKNSKLFTMCPIRPVYISCLFMHRKVKLF